jgi:hypothetical protein
MTTLGSAGRIPGNVTDSYPHFCGGTEVLTEGNSYRSRQWREARTARFAGRILRRGDDLPGPSR